jgi:hypothetical protein
MGDFRNEKQTMEDGGLQRGHTKENELRDEGKGSFIVTSSRIENYCAL